MDSCDLNLQKKWLQKRMLKMEIHDIDTIEIFMI
jgi:hypothetical protein